MRQATFVAESAQNTEQFIDVRGPIDRLASLSEFHVLPQRHDRAGVGLAGAIQQPSFLVEKNYNLSATATTVCVRLQLFLSNRFARRFITQANARCRATVILRGASLPI
jgi:hypothetical protein